MTSAIENRANTNKESRDFKGVWIPKEIYLSTNLSWTEKILLIEIDSLDTDERGCFASNQYLGEFLNVKATSVANIISKLRAQGYIEQLWFDGRSRGLRVRFQELEPSSKNESSSHKKMKSGSRKSESRVHKKVNSASQKNEHINTVNNTSINTVSLKQEKEENTRVEIPINSVPSMPKSEPPAAPSASDPKLSEKLHNFPVLKNQPIPVVRLNELAELFAHIAGQQDRKTLIREGEWVEMCKNFEKEGMSADGIKSLYRYCKEIVKCKSVTPKVMNWKFSEYKEFVKKQQAQAAQKSKPKSQPFDPNRIKLENNPLPAGY